MNSPDNRTLSDGYFHATADSKNAHSHLCREINANVHGTFGCDFMDPKLMVVRPDDQQSVLTNTQRLVFVTAIDCRQEVQVLVEQRNGLSLSTLEVTYAELERTRQLQAYEQSFIPHFFPKVSFAIVGTNASNIPRIIRTAMMCSFQRNSEPAQG